MLLTLPACDLPFPREYDARISSIVVDDTPEVGKSIQFGVNGWAASTTQKFKQLVANVDDNAKKITIRMVLESNSNIGDAMVAFRSATSSFVVHSPGIYSIVSSKGDATASFEAQSSPI
jgi:hypothetical protein